MLQSLYVSGTSRSLMKAETLPRTLLQKSRPRRGESIWDIYLGTREAIVPFGALFSVLSMPMSIGSETLSRTLGRIMALGTVPC